MARFCILIAFCQMLFAVGCSNNADPRGGGTQSNVLGYDLAELFHAPADPIQVEVEADPDRAVSATIPVEGGTLKAVAADGTRFMLEIPDGALLGPTTVTITPIRRIIDLPLSGGLGGAVLLEPSELVFFSPLTLTIEPAREIPLDEQVTFGFGGGGEDFHMVPPIVTSAAIQIELLHFSGYGVGRGVDRDRALVLLRKAHAAEQRLSSQTAEFLLQARRAALAGTGSTLADLIDSSDGLFEQYYEQVVKPRLEAGQANCQFARLAIQTYLGYERQRQLLGIANDEEPLRPEWASLLSNSAKLCLREAYEKCVEQHDLLILVQTYLGVERQLQLMGEDGSLDQFVAPLFEACYRFELEFASTAGMTSPDGRYESKVTSRVVLQLPMGNWDQVLSGIGGSAPLISESFRWWVGSCELTGVRGGGELRVFRVGPIVDKHGIVSDIELVYDPGTTSESASGTCDGATHHTPQMAYWTLAYLALHLDEITSSEESDQPPLEPKPIPTLAGFPGMPDPSKVGAGLPSLTGMPMQSATLKAVNWEMLRKELYARKLYDRRAAVDAHETTLLTLWHRPVSVPPSP